MNGYNFTERTRKIFREARDEAAAVGAEYVEPEHVLLALLADDGVGSIVVDNLVDDRSRVADAVRAKLKRETDKPDFAPDLPYSSAAKRVIELSMSEARNMQHSYVGTEHVLLGIAAEAKSISAHVLHSFGVTVASARAEVLRVLGHEADTMPPHGEKPQRVSLMLHYSNGAIVAKSFTNATEASSFLSAM